MSNILINKKTLDDYLKDFHKSKMDEILILFDNFNYDIGKFSFAQKMKSVIGMPQVGSTTTIYWTSRGWSESESLLKRKKIIRNPDDSPMNINFWIKRGFNKSDAEFRIKSQRKMNKEYWLCRGFDEDVSVIKLNEFQKNSNKKYIDKLKSNDSFRESVNSKRSNNINYWLNLGYNLEEANVKISERQSTFSLDKCISKYGTIGKEVWAQRQEKWKKSLSESYYNGSDGKDSKSIDFFIKKYNNDNNWIEVYIMSLSFKDKDNIRYLMSFVNYKEMILALISSNISLRDINFKINYKILEYIYNVTLDDMRTFLLNNYEVKCNTPAYYEKIYGENWCDEFINRNVFKYKDEVKFLLTFDDYKKMIEYLIINFRITDIVLKIQNSIISYYYKSSYVEMFNYLMNTNPYIKGKFGYMRYFNNHLCRSSGEYIISKYLLDNNIDYMYEKSYPNSNKRCDFYLIDKNIYLEYTGMSSIKKYRDKYNEKMLFCVENNIDHYFSDEIDEIKNKVKELYGI